MSQVAAHKIKTFNTHIYVILATIMKGKKTLMLNPTFLPTSSFQYRTSGLLCWVALDSVQLLCAS